MVTTSALYVGSVSHRRRRPSTHRLRYRVFYLLLDIDDLPRLARKLRFFSINRFNLFSFRAKNHLSGAGDDLRGEIERLLAQAGMEPDGGAIRLLTMPRILGYGFNPLSMFFCYRRDGALRAIVYEVNNTFGQRHSYLFPVSDGEKGIMRHACSKEFYVSPFMDMDMSYAFSIRPPGETFTLSISVLDAKGPILDAAQSLRRRPLTDAGLMHVFVSHPLLGLKVMAGIHFEALLIWLKGVGLRERPPPPHLPVTIVAKEHQKRTASHVATDFS
ncbi:MAG: hypothetical protein CTY15_08440 [Methylocystis sp.]|nr:MAG: hypothetical protein CTY15_08440 [Methylocystis sp.]